MTKKPTAQKSVDDRVRVAWCPDCGSRVGRLYHRPAHGKVESWMDWWRCLQCGWTGEGTNIRKKKPTAQEMHGKRFEKITLRPSRRNPRPLLDAEPGTRATA